MVSGIQPEVREHINAVNWARLLTGQDVQCVYLLFPYMLLQIYYFVRWKDRCSKVVEQFSSGIVLAEYGASRPSHRQLSSTECSGI